METLATRSWNGTPIQRRTTDGYVNATAMCKANDKAWNEYWRLNKTTEYLEALSLDTGISVSRLCLTMRGGAQQGTWVHPRVAVDLARWISAPFAVWMDKWFLESLAARASQVQDTQPGPTAVPALSPQDSLDLIERSMDLLERLGGMDDRDRLQFGDMVRNVTARGAGGYLLPPAPEDEELTLSDAWLEVFGEALPRSKFSPVGTLVANTYKEEFGAKPPKRTQYVDGAPRKVSSYKRGWLLRTLQRFKEQVFGKKG
jgi:hypothetical protein